MLSLFGKRRDDWSLAARLRGVDERERWKWDRRLVRRPDQIPAGAEAAGLARERASHKGIGELQSLRYLVAGAVDQPFLDEIGRLERLERLELGPPVTASHLDGLLKLPRLRHLGIDSPRNIKDFSPLLRIATLQRLFIENANHITDVEWLGDDWRIESFGIEGSMWNVRPLKSLRPMVRLQSLKGLFLSSIRLEDKDLSPLADMPNLHLLHCARFAPRTEFERLKEARPDLQCSWFDPSAWK